MSKELKMGFGYDKHEYKRRVKSLGPLNYVNRFQNQRAATVRKYCKYVEGRNCCVSSSDKTNIE